MLQPLVFAFIFALFFGVVLHIHPPGGPAVCGLRRDRDRPLAVHLDRRSSTAPAAWSRTPNLIAKVYFPRLALPISKALSLLIDLAIALVVVIVVTLLYGVRDRLDGYLVPAFLLLGVVTAFALATLLSAVNVKYRDVQLVVPMLIQILFFASPVLYSGTQVGDQAGQAWSYIYSINPMASVLDGMRWALVDQPYPGTVNILISVGSALLLLVGALLYFRRAEHFFADVI